MIRTFTLNDLVSYFYGETTKEETKEIAHALSEDKYLQKQYAEIVAVTGALDNINMSPSKECTDRIFGYARDRNKQGKLTQIDS